MNEVWNLDPLYKGFDDPAFGADMGRVRELASQINEFAAALPQAEPLEGLREGIRLMGNTGNKVTMVGCTFDDHVRISLDAMGMGVVDWAVGDRALPCNPEIYSFTRLVPDVG